MYHRYIKDNCGHSTDNDGCAMAHPSQPVPTSARWDGWAIGTPIVDRTPLVLQAQRLTQAHVYKTFELTHLSDRHDWNHTFTASDEHTLKPRPIGLYLGRVAIAVVGEHTYTRRRYFDVDTLQCSASAQANASIQTPALFSYTRTHVEMYSSLRRSNTCRLKAFLIGSSWNYMLRAFKNV